MGRRPKQYSQAERLARMIRALASRACTVNDLAQDFAVTRRQVYRDLARIEEEGNPLTQSDGPGERTWQLPLGYTGLPPITLTPLELMSLYLARSNLAYLAGTPFMDDLDGVLDKIRSGLPQGYDQSPRANRPLFSPSSEAAPSL
jgi:predicted DNA-binding transcriptional regulator YafY